MVQQMTRPTLTTLKRLVTGLKNCGSISRSNEKAETLIDRIEQAIPADDEAIVKKECQHEPVIIKEFNYDGCGGMVVWCKQCGAHCIHDEYTHDKPEEWDWQLPETRKFEN
jgi:ABC-type hemin transport system substrate-binding protein